MYTYNVVKKKTCKLINTKALIYITKEYFANISEILYNFWYIQ